MGDDAIAWLYYLHTPCLWTNIKFNKNNTQQLLLQEHKLQLIFLSLVYTQFFQDMRIDVTITETYQNGVTRATFTNDTFACRDGVDCWDPSKFSLLSHT